MTNHTIDQPNDHDPQALLAAGRPGPLEPEEASELALLTDLLADPSTWAEPDAGLEDAVAQAVAGAEPSGAVGTATASRRAPAAGRRRVILSAAAAVAVLVIAAGAVLAVRGGTGTDYRAQLASTDLAPGASASVDITRNESGFRIGLDATGLPALPAGQYYQAWLKNPGGTLVPIGSFSSSDGRVTLWSGVSPTEFATLTVTIEASDNDQASSGHRVLIGQVVAG